MVGEVLKVMQDLAKTGMTIINHYGSPASLCLTGYLAASFTT